jgi:uncharacterized protein
MISPEQWEALWENVSGQFLLGELSEHGPSHWKRVEQNGLYLAQFSSARVDVIRLFAVFHDSRRENELDDPGHGVRGAKLAGTLREVLFQIDDVGFDLLTEACSIHTKGPLNAEPTIGSCLDADRLDLPRVGIRPKPEFMSTSAGRELARTGNLAVLRDFQLRHDL